MSRLFKIGILVFSCNLFFICDGQAGMFKKSDDPCNIIPGKWRSHVKFHWDKRCSYDGEFYGSSFNDNNFELTGDLVRTSSSNPECVEQIHSIIKGRCIDGNIYGDYPGYIYGNSIYLENAFARYTFFKE